MINMTTISEERKKIMMWQFHEKEKFEIDTTKLSREEKMDLFNTIAVKDEYKCSFSEEFIHDSTKLLVTKGEWTLDEVAYDGR